MVAPCTRPIGPLSASPERRAHSAQGPPPVNSNSPVGECVYHQPLASHGRRLAEGEGVEPLSSRIARFSGPLAHHRAPPSDAPRYAARRSPSVRHLGAGSPATQGRVHPRRRSTLPSGWRGGFARGHCLRRDTDPHRALTGCPSALQMRLPWDISPRRLSLATRSALAELAPV